MYVRTIDPQTNRITLSPAHEPRASLVEIGEMNWFELPAPGRIYGARVRHSRKMGEAKWVSGATDSCVLRVSPDCGVPAPGQSAVLYDGERVLGGGVIFHVFEENL